jgi:hypothetical protein
MVRCWTGWRNLSPVLSKSLTWKMMQIKRDAMIIYYQGDCGGCPISLDFVGFFGLQLARFDGQMIHHISYLSGLKANTTRHSKVRRPGIISSGVVSRFEGEVSRSSGMTSKPIRTLMFRIMMIQCR